MKNLLFWIIVGYAVVSYIIYQKMDNAYQREKNATLSKQLQITQDEVKKRNEKEICFSNRIEKYERAAKKKTSFDWNYHFDYNDSVLNELRKD